MVGLSRRHQFPSIRLDVQAAPWAALAFLGAVSAGSYANRRRQRGVVSLSHAIASLEAGKSPGWPWLIRHSGAVTDLGATLSDPLNQ